MNPANFTFRTDLAGVWRRLPTRPVEQAGEGLAVQHDAMALRVQAGAWFAQWEQSAAVQSVQPLALDALAPSDLALLADQQAQWGVMHLESHPEGEVAHWLPRVDFQPPGLQSVSGWLLFDQPDRFIEIATDTDRTQVWVRDPGTAWFADEVWCLQALDEQGREDGRYLLGAADWRVYLRPRRSRWPRGAHPGLTLHDLLLHQPEQAMEWLDHELSLGRCVGTRCEILCSSLPQHQGRTVQTTVSWSDDRQRAHVRWGSEEGWWQRMEAMAP